MDLRVDPRLLVELKATEGPASLHLAQVLSYLKASRLTLGLLINFNVASLRQGGKASRSVSPPKILCALCALCGSPLFFRRPRRRRRKEVTEPQTGTCSCSCSAGRARTRTRNVHVIVIVIVAGAYWEANEERRARTSRVASRSLPSMRKSPSGCLFEAWTLTRTVAGGSPSRRPSSREPGGAGTVDRSAIASAAIVATRASPPFAQRTWGVVTGASPRARRPSRRARRRASRCPRACRSASSPCPSRAPLSLDRP